MEIDRFSDEAQDFLPGFSNRDAAGKIRHMRSPTGLPAPHDNHVAHADLRYFFQPACLRMVLSVSLGVPNA